MKVPGLNPWEYAIIKAYKRLVEESERRELTAKEIRLAELLQDCIDRYEAREVSSGLKT